jgi:uncharacterized protein YdaU (DUF1376 family)
VTLPFYPFYWGDYSAKTFNLSQGQHGAYMLLMRHIYTGGGPITHEQRFSIAKATLPQEQENADFILAKFFTKQGNEWINSKALEVMEEWEDKHQRRVIAAQKPRKQCLSNGEAAPEQSLSNQNQNQNQLKKKILKEKGEGRPFVIEGTEQWAAWKQVKGSKLSARDTRIDERIVRGWYLPSEWPPGFPKEVIPKTEDDLEMPAFLRRVV